MQVDLKQLCWLYQSFNVPGPDSFVGLVIASKVAQYMQLMPQLRKMHTTSNPLSTTRPGALSKSGQVEYQSRSQS